MAAKVKEYVPGYDLALKPVIENKHITTVVNVQGQGDFLPAFAGNLDIETSSAVKIGELYAKELLRT